jgi:multiple sugar transport system permease protein
MSFFGLEAGEINFVGFSNYIELINSERFHVILKNTLIFTFASVFFHLGFGLFLASLLNINIKFRNLFRALQLIPWLFPPMVACIFWLLMYQRQLGLINNVLLSLNLSHFAREWLGSPNTAMAAVIVVNVWLGYSFFTLMILAGMQNIPISLYEAAQIDGATGWKSFTHITLPLLKPVLLTLFILDTIWTFRVFDVIWVLTKGGPVYSTEVLATYTYKIAFTEFDYYKAATVGGFMLIIMVIFTLFYVSVYTRKD